MKHTALLLVDLQNAYFNNVALREMQTQLTEKTNELIAFAKQHEMPIFNIKTEHQIDNATWTLNMLDDKQGYLFKNDTDSQNIAGLNTTGSIELIKTRDSAFYDTTLLAMLRNHAVTSVIICGVSTDTCIMQTAADAYAANIRVTLVKDAIASHEPKFHTATFNILTSEYRQRLLSADDLKNDI